MSEKDLNLTRRKFMVASSAAIAAPLVMKMTGTVPRVNAAEKGAEPQYKGMKSIVIYYSMSGNTKKIGQAIQKGITKQTGQCDLVRVKEIKPEESEKYDLIGIGHPFLRQAGGMAEGERSGGAGGREGSTPSQTSEKRPYPLEIPTSMNYVCELEGVPNTEGSKYQPGNELKINPDKCIRCGRCVKGCPTYNIDDSVFPYVFKTQDCEYCMFCEGLCPAGAIEFKFRSPRADTGSGERPTNVQLALAEGTGRFRRLLKEEDVGYNTPWEVVTTHPRYKELP